MLDSAELRPGHERRSERVLRLYHLYRIVVGLAMVVLVQTGLHEDLLPLVSAPMFQLVSWVYLLSNVVISVLHQQPDRSIQLFFTALLDISLLSLLFYEAGGIPSGLGSLLVISVAIANSLLKGRIGVLIAAMASISLIFLTFYLSLSRSSATSQYVQAGGLGLLCFTAALAIQALSRRLELSEATALRHAATVADLQVLNALILQRMRTGIIVVDPEQRILLANPASRSLLGQTPMSNEPLGQRFSELQASLQDWTQNPSLTPQSFRGHAEGPVLQPSFAPLQRKGEQDLLIFLEDVSQITQQAQQIKLASLGRLTASIAHEIRNPLGAISHAAQLLQESDDMVQADRRLIQIILNHSQRMNLIIENILQLSRRRQAEPQLLELQPWLLNFCEEQRSALHQHSAIELQITDASLQTQFDPDQLSQVLVNLIQNAVRYSERRHGQGRVTLHLFLEPERKLPALDVLDDGEGISAEVASSLFEPFFTTENKGTGLGLYISRELCESNRARLDHIPTEGEGACFRLTFAHPHTTS